MRLVVTQNMTLDGRIEMIDSWFDPGAQDADLAEEIRALSAKEQVLLLGRQTFCDFRGYWPHQSDDTTGVTEQLNRVDKRVVSATMTDPEWENSTIIDGDPLAAVRELRREPGNEICVTGSIQLTHALVEADLVDEYRLFVYPAWQGRGRGLFPDGIAAPPLRLLRSRSFPSGVVLACYEPTTDR